LAQTSTLPPGGEIKAGSEKRALRTGNKLPIDRVAGDDAASRNETAGTVLISFRLELGDNFMAGQLVALIPLLASSLVGCDVNRDIRKRTYVSEVACDSFLQEDTGGTYKCDEKLVDLKKHSNDVPHTIKVNRRAGKLALDGRPLDDCRLVDLDDWRCVLRLGVIGKSRIVNPYPENGMPGTSVDINTSER
jgi:hypothetical protein